MKNLTLLASSTLLALITHTSYAHKAGDIIVRYGFAVVDSESSGNSVFAGGANTGVDVNVEDNTGFGITGAYMITE